MVRGSEFSNGPRDIFANIIKKKKKLKISKFHVCAVTTAVFSILESVLKFTNNSVSISYVTISKTVKRRNQSR